MPVERPDSLEDQASFVVQKRARKAEVGPSTKDGRRFKKQITRTKATLVKLLSRSEGHVDEGGL